jgi:hypothetical protein
MKQSVATVMLCIVCAANSAFALDVAPHLGEKFYGLYMNGQKVGYAAVVLTQTAEGDVIFEENARFLITMAGVEQDMRTNFARTYGSDQKLKSLDATVDAVTRSEFHAKLIGDELVMTSTVGEVVTESRFPRPDETLGDILKLAELVRNGGKVSQKIAFAVFDPVYQQVLTGSSRISGVETRLLDGVSTQIYEVHTDIEALGLETISHVAEDGTVLEDVTGGFLTMRLEPEEVAKDVTYNNDTIISNAARIKEPIEAARTRSKLTLRIVGPLADEHLFETKRQTFAREEDACILTSTQVSLQDLPPVSLPADNPEVAEWLKPTLFVQSDHEDIIKKSREIVGSTTNALTVATKLSEWVHKSVKTTFSARLTNSREVLQSLEGDCTEHSVLFVGLARAAGLPAREVAGLIYVDGPSPGFYFHQWAEVWVGEWIEADPTFNQVPADVTHVKLAEGDLFQQTKLLPIIGRLEVEVVEEATESS